MAEIINLRLVRKAQKRKLAQAAANANRAKFGQPKAERIANQQETERAARLIENARLERD